MDFCITLESNKGEEYHDDFAGGANEVGPRRGGGRRDGLGVVLWHGHARRIELDLFRGCGFVNLTSDFRSVD